MRCTVEVLCPLLVVAACASGRGGAEPAAPRVQSRTRAPAADPSPTGEAPDDPRSEGPEAAPQPADPPPLQAVDPMTFDGAHSTSVGDPNDGTLQGGVPLPEASPGLRSNPRRPNADGFYGTVEMVQALVRAAAVVAAEHPDSEVTVNDLGFESGGPIPHHASHQSGRDVDVLFYLLDDEGRPRQGKGVPIDPRGVGWDFGDLEDASDDVRVRIDIPRTWRFLQALVEDPEAHLQRVFVVEHVRTMLMEHAERTRAPATARRLIGDATCQPGSPHDDHLHFRFFCTAEDISAGCEDTAPMYPWRRTELRAAGVTPVIARYVRPASRPNTTSPAEARAAAGPMHAAVRAFLDEREQWIRRPRPGRPYCR